MGAALLFVVMSIAYLGFGLLALSQDRNWGTVTGASRLSRSEKLIMRAAGYILLACGLPVALWRDGPGFGSLLWVASLSVAAVAVVATLSWRPRWLVPLAATIRAITAL